MPRNGLRVYLALSFAILSCLLSGVGCASVKPYFKPDQTVALYADKDPDREQWSANPKLGEFYQVLYEISMMAEALSHLAK